MTSRGFTVEPPGRGDAAIWRELYRAYADFYHEAVTDAQLDLVWSWITDPGHDVKALLVRDASGAACGWGDEEVIEVAGDGSSQRPEVRTVVGQADRGTARVTNQ